MRKRKLWLFLVAALCCVALFATPVLADESAQAAGQSGSSASSQVTGICKDVTGATEYTYYYVNGVVQDTTDVVYIDGKWYNLVNGRVVGNTVAHNSSGWFYINADGVVDFGYTGFAKNDYGCWYIENGAVNFGANSIIYGSVNGESAWWYVKGGCVQTDATTVASNEYGWFYVKNGKVDFSYTGIAPNEYGWWRIVGGAVDFGCNSVESNEYGWFYIKNGCVDFSYTGLAQNGAGWWRIVGGAVDFTATGLVSSETGWWYVENGLLNTGYTGIVPNEYGWWYVQNGTIDFSAATVASNEYGWWCIRNGCVDFGYNGIATNDAGAWYISGGAVDFSYTGSARWGTLQVNVVAGRVQTGTSTSMTERAQSVSSKTRYLIMVDTSACRLGVFAGSQGNWTPVYYWACSPGKSSTPTVKGTFTVNGRGKSFGKEGSYTCWYYTRFYGNYLFHSVLYNPGSMTSIQDGRLGQQLSHGCVRLDINNAKWIYDNIPDGTTVVVW